MKKTAVEWLVEKMLNQDWYTYKSLEYIKQAKEMEKEQHSVTYGNSLKDMINKKIDFEQYYNETFNNGIETPNKDNQEI